MTQPNMHNDGDKRPEAYRPTWMESLADRGNGQLTVNVAPMALVLEARRLAEDLCSHWSDAGEKPCVQDVVDWLPETVVADLRSLAGALEEAWEQVVNTDDADASSDPEALVTHAQVLLGRLQAALERRFRTLDLPDRRVLEDDIGSSSGSPQLAELVDALDLRVRIAETFRDELLQAGYLDLSSLEQGRMAVRLLQQLIRPEQGEVDEAAAVRLHTLAVRLQSLLLVARRAASAYSVRVGFQS